ncbi:MAG: flavin-containing monooxygenase [Acidimicrobiales bacterium]
MGASAAKRRRLRIAIIGAGPGGLCAAIRLKQEGFDDFVLIEKAAGLGGTWFHNRYPGCACDVQSHLYSFSFEPNLSWSRPYARQPEILAYLEQCAATHDIGPHCRFETAVEQARWDEDRAQWSLTLSTGDTIDADVVVSAVGMFNELAYPPVVGIDDFAGTCIHSARWDWDHDLTAERVGIIGSAASAVQLMPEVAKVAEQVHLFQRTANWVLPKEDTPFTEAELEHFRTTPAAARELRQQIYSNFEIGSTFSNQAVLADRETVGLAAIDEVVDPEVRAALRPQHPFGCKRPLFSNDFYAAFNRTNVELVTSSIDHITESAVVTDDGKTRPVDTLVFATGFETTKFLSTIDVVGRGGRRLSDAWNDGAQAYLGITTAGFPNLFMLYGPNTNNGSIIEMIEHQVHHTLAHLERLVADDLAWVDVRPEVMEKYNDEIQREIDGVAVWQAGCNTYYRTPSGRVVTQWPLSMKGYGERTETPDEAAFEAAAR